MENLKQAYTALEHFDFRDILAYIRTNGRITRNFIVKTTTKKTLKIPNGQSIITGKVSLQKNDSNLLLYFLFFYCIIHST